MRRDVYPKIPAGTTLTIAGVVPQMVTSIKLSDDVDRDALRVGLPIPLSRRMSIGAVGFAGRISSVRTQDGD